MPEGSSPPPTQESYRGKTSSTPKLTAPFTAAESGWCGKLLPWWIRLEEACGKGGTWCRLTGSYSQRMAPHGEGGESSDHISLKLPGSGHFSTGHPEVVAQVLRLISLLPSQVFRTHHPVQNQLA